MKNCWRQFFNNSQIFKICQELRLKKPKEKKKPYKIIVSLKLLSFYHLSFVLSSMIRWAFFTGYVIILLNKTKIVKNGCLTLKLLFLKVTNDESLWYSAKCFQRCSSCSRQSLRVPLSVNKQRSELP